MRRTALTALAALATLAGTPAAALADSTAVIRDCQDGRIDGKYSQKEFADALRNIPTDVDEYTDCRDVISRARLGAAGGKSGGARTGSAGGGGGGGATPAAPAATGADQTAAQLLGSASPAERAAVTRAIGQAGTAPVVVGGRSVSPDTAGLSPAGAANVLPTPLIAALVLLGLGLVAAAIQTIRTRVLAGRAPTP